MKMPSIGLGQLGKLTRLQRVTEDIERANHDDATLLRMMRTAPTPAAGLAAGTVYVSRHPEALTAFIENLGPESLESPPHRIMLMISGLGLFSTDVLEMEVQKCES